jgi:hypothetical protein
MYACERRAHTVRVARGRATDLSSELVTRVRERPLAGLSAVGYYRYSVVRGRTPEARVRECPERLTSCAKELADWHLWWKRSGGESRLGERAGMSLEPCGRKFSRPLGIRSER